MLIFSLIIRACGLIAVSVENIALLGEIKGIKPECNSLAVGTNQEEFA